MSRWPHIPPRLPCPASGIAPRATWAQADGRCLTTNVWELADPFCYSERGPGLAGRLACSRCPGAVWRSGASAVKAGDCVHGERHIAQSGRPRASQGRLSQLAPLFPAPCMLVVKRARLLQIPAIPISMPAPCFLCVAADYLSHPSPPCPRKSHRKSTRLARYSQPYLFGPCAHVASVTPFPRCSLALSHTRFPWTFARPTTTNTTTTPSY